VTDVESFSRWGAPFLARAIGASQTTLERTPRFYLEDNNGREKEARKGGGGRGGGGAIISSQLKREQFNILEKFEGPSR